MKDFLTRVFTKEWFNKVANFIESQIYSNEPNEVKAEKAVDFGFKLIEEIEVEIARSLPVPLDWVAKILSKLDDKIQRNLVIILVEAIYRGVKISHERMMARGVYTVEDLKVAIEKGVAPAAAIELLKTLSDNSLDAVKQEASGKKSKPKAV